MVAEDVPGVGPVLERLVDDWSVEPIDDSTETLRLSIGAGGASA